MKTYLNRENPWHIREEGFNPEFMRISESVMSQGNGHMGMRANFEEKYSGDSLQGSYMAGVYYPDKTRVGWWKNGYPEYFAKVLNSCNWIGLHLYLNNEEVDLNHCKILSFTRDLNMQDGLLEREVHGRTPTGVEFKIHSRRFVSLKRLELGVLQYKITLCNSKAHVRLESYLDGKVYNEDSNYDEYFWEPLDSGAHGDLAWVAIKTRKTGFLCQSSLVSKVHLEGKAASGRIIAEALSREAYGSHQFQTDLPEGGTLVLEKYVSQCSSRDREEKELADYSSALAEKASIDGFQTLLEEQQQSWAEKWEQCDIIIEGEAAAQQGIRFNIFQLYQTYNGHDDRLNIGPKGFTGEKYGGSTYWDTEAYCLPFYMSTAPQEVSRQLLVYRYKQLPQAIENAEKLGFSRGAALYPMVTMTGEECHNEWEITFEEIHRNGAIAYAVMNYIRYTGDRGYLLDGGLDVLIGIGRFWVQRASWSENKKAYVILGVTGPNEYENNVNNNWYTNRMAQWCLQYTLDVMEALEKEEKKGLSPVLKRCKWMDEEATDFRRVAENLYFPEDPERGIFLQQDGFLDKELRGTDSLKEEERPINQHWSWDRILRSCFIKQADVLQGLFFLEDQYDGETLRRNFDFYEPMTVHESSLSPCVYSILANRIDRQDKAYQLYLQTARLDLDDYNNDTEDGCHITSMAGTWMAVVYGFGGLRIHEDRLHLTPKLPKNWNRLCFRLLFREREIKVDIKKDRCDLILLKGSPLSIYLNGEERELS